MLAPRESHRKNGHDCQPTLHSRDEILEHFNRACDTANRGVRSKLWLDLCAHSSDYTGRSSAPHRDGLAFNTWCRAAFCGHWRQAAQISTQATSHPASVDWRARSEE